MDGLSCLLEDNISRHLFEGICTANGDTISHLLYADDLIIIGKANAPNLQHLSQILLTFQKETNLFINHYKSLFTCSTPTQNQQLLSNIIGLPLTSPHFKYLRILVLVHKPNLTTLHPLLEKISQSLDGWKANCLSLAGRYQLLKFSIWNIIAYWSRSLFLISCIKHINKRCSKFLLHGNQEAKKLHMVAWQNICKPKSNGGLGIPSIEALSFTFMSKLIWKVFQTPTPHSAWLSSKYISIWKTPLSKASHFWKKLHPSGLDPSLNFGLVWAPPFLCCGILRSMGLAFLKYWMVMHFRLSHFIVSLIFLSFSILRVGFYL